MGGVYGQTMQINSAINAQSINQSPYIDNTGKRKKLHIVVIIVLFLIFIIGGLYLLTSLVDDEEYTYGVYSGAVGDNDDMQDTYQNSEESENSEEVALVDTYMTGDTVKFKIDDSMVNITIADWGKSYESTLDDEIYVDYIVENVGKQTVSFTDSYFELYGDGYKISESIGDESIIIENISSGRKLRAKAYYDMNPDDYSVIELQCGDTVFLLKYDGEALKKNTNNDLYDSGAEGFSGGDASANFANESNGNIDYLGTYSSILEEICHSYDDYEYCEYTLYDLDGDGIKELITSEGTCNADWLNNVYTLGDGQYVTMIGQFYGSVMLYVAEDGNGLYAVSGRSEYQNIDQITKNGSQLQVETIMSGENGFEEDYYSNDNPVNFITVTDDSLLR